ncbi:MAG: hypothetical protein SGILL_006870, partial [Bacillariaceae sp.]
SADCRHITTTALQLQRSMAATTVIELAADAASLNDAAIRTNHVGYSGNGFIDYGATRSAFASWSVDVPADGSYEVTIRYASANTRGPMPLFVGATKIGDFPIAATGGWTSWREETFTASLSAGNNQVFKLSAQNVMGPNVDKITLKTEGTGSDPDADPNYKTVLAPNQSLSRNRYVQNSAGTYEVGLDSTGDLVVRETAASFVVWSLEASLNKDLPGDKFYMQNDGNLVLRDPAGKAIWSSRTYGNPDTYFAIDDQGGIAAIKLLDNNEVLWNGGLTSRSGPITTPGPVPSPTPSPTPRPTQPSGGGPTQLPRNMPSGLVLRPNTNFQRQVFKASPNGQYQVGINSVGNLVMVRGGSEVWRLKDKWRRDISGIGRAYMQSDGNLVLRTSSGSGLWNSETSKNPGSEFRIDDGGQVSIVYNGAVLWMDGIPRGVYNGPSSFNLEFPIRGIFYYAW